MKFLLFLLIVLLATWLWRSGRRDTSGSDRPATPPSPSPPQEMVRCTLCGTHLPHSEAIVGRTGIYCCAEHRQSAEP